MADNNRLELVISAIDNTEGATTKARANMRNFVEEAIKAAQGASNSFDKAAVDMARSIDKGSASAMRSLEALERRAALAGKSAVGKLAEQRDQMVNSLGLDEASNQRIRAAYEKIISARQKFDEDMKKRNAEGEGGAHSQVLRRGILGIKDFLEGSTRGAIIEGTDILVGTSGGGGILQKAIPQIAELTGLSNGAVIAVGGLTAAFVGLGFAGIESMKSLAEAGEQIQKFSLSTGIAPTRVQAFQFAAKAEGADPSVFQRLSSEISRAGDDYSEEGAKKRDQLGRLGVNLYDRFGDLKPTEQVLLDVADGLDKLSPGLERNAAAARLFGESSKEVLPVLENLRRNLATSDEIGNTFSEHDLAMMERWHESLTRMGEEWTRFKLKLEVPLGIAGEVILKGIRFLGTPSGGTGIAGSYAAQLGEAINSHLFQQDTITPPSPGRDDLRRAAEKQLADQARERYLALQRQDPAFRLSEARKKLTTLDTAAQHGLADDVESAQEQFKLVKSLEAKTQSNKTLEGVVAARKERLQLEAQYAEIEQSSQQKIQSASLNSRSELTSPNDIARMLQLADARVNAEQQKILNDRRYRVDDKSGTIQDLSGTPEYRQFAQEESANLPLRLRNEYAKAIGELEVQDARYFAARTDADGKAWEAAWQRRQRGELELQQEEINTRQSIQARQFDIDGSTIDRQKEMALQSLDGVNAQTLQEKSALEDRKFAIEQAYAEKSLENQIAKLNNQQALEIAGIQKKASESGNTNSEAEAADIAAARDKYQQQIDAARGATTDREIIDAQKAQSAKEKLQIESNRKVYDSLKQDAAGLFDQLVFHTKSWGDFFKDLFKATILTPVKEIFSSQVAALFTKGLTGSDVSFGEVGNGQGALGRLGGIFGRAGLGAPRFGVQQPHKLEQPGHLGDLSLVQGAVPVVLMNTGGSGPVSASSGGGGFSLGSLATGVGLAGLFSGGATAAASSASSSRSGYSFPDGIIDGTSSPGSFSSLAKLVGGPGGTSGFAGPVAGYGGLSSTAYGGILGRLGGLFGKIPGFGRGSGDIDPESGAPLGHGIPGSPDNSSGEVSGFGSHGGTVGGALAAIGLPVAIDGIRRGGLLGTLEAAGGGAAIGFRFGGPVGALIGAAVGGGIAGLKSIFGNDRQHAKDLVKQVYGMDINNATADQIIAIAKQGYGNQIDVAVRSPQVRDLLKLYAQTVGNKSAQDQFEQSQVHSASFVESGGKLQQQAIYDNGNAYAYSSPLATYGGVATSPLSTFAPNQGVFNGNLQINLNGQSASDALAGQVVRVATPGFVQGQALAASNSSIGRTAQQNMTLSPSALRS